MFSSVFECISFVFIYVCFCVCIYSFCICISCVSIYIFRICLCSCTNDQRKEDEDGRMPVNEGKNGRQRCDPEYCSQSEHLWISVKILKKLNWEEHKNVMEWSITFWYNHNNYRRVDCKKFQPLQRPAHLKIGKSAKMQVPAFQGSKGKAKQTHFIQ